VTKAKKSFVTGCPDEGGRGGAGAKHKVFFTTNFPVKEEYIEENPGTSQISYSLHILLFLKVSS
jgi:hypothetical protein